VESRLTFGSEKLYRVPVKSPAILLWLIYAATGLPLTIFGYLFTGGGLPRFALLDDWTNPILVLVWAFGAFLVVFLPALAMAATVWALREKLRDKQEADAS